MGRIIVMKIKEFFMPNTSASQVKLAWMRLAFCSLSRMRLICMVVSSPSLSRKRKRIGVIFPSVSVQEIICTGILIQNILSMSVSSFACRNMIERMFGKVNRKYYADRLSHSISFPMGTALRNIMTALSEGMEK